MRLPISINSATVALGAYHKNRTLVCEKVDGIAFTLPSARGTGNKFRIAIGTALTSSTITVTASASAKLQGGVFINDTGDSPAATADFVPAVAGTSTIVTLTQSAGAGAKGDWLEFEDIKTALWQVSGVLSGEADPANPFS